MCDSCVLSDEPAICVLAEGAGKALDRDINWRHHQIRLRRLEAEAIHIFREVAAEFRNPVLLYSIGKDSSVMRV
jgi:hypothetical protein